jgi:proline iminopeptidase
MKAPISETFVAADDGVPLWTIAGGSGPVPVLLSNGGPGCVGYLAPLATLLQSPARRIVRWEQRGIGRSGGDPSGPWTIDRCLADMEAIRRSYGASRWVVAGHSWGADLSLIYALSHPERCAGLLCVAGGRLTNDREWHAAYTRGREEGRELAPDDALPANTAVNQQLSAEFKRYVQRPTLWREVASLPHTRAFPLWGKRHSSILGRRAGCHPDAACAIRVAPGGRPLPLPQSSGRRALLRRHLPA